MEKMGSQDQPSPQVPQSKGTTFLRTCFNGLNVLAGVGILSIPYALAEGGWLSLIILVLVATICCYTGLLLQQCMDENPLIKTYPDIGHVAFGMKGRTLISIFMYLELYLVAVEFLILEGDNLHKLFPRENFKVCGKFKIEGKQAFVVLTTLVVLPTTWLRNLGALAYVSVGGIFACVALVVSVFWVGAFDGVGFHEQGVLWRWSGFTITTSLYTFCYCGHAVFPTLYTSMKDKTKFPKVLIVCFFLTTINYGSMALQGYLMYGEHLMSQITLNLPTKLLSSKIAIYTTLINPITKYALIISPIAAALEDRIGSRNNRTISVLVRTSLVASTAVVALAVPFFSYVMTFIGAFLSVAVAILFPCLCYLKIKKVPLSFGIELILIGGILVLGVFIGITGTYTSLRDILMQVQSE